MAKVGNRQNKTLKCSVCGEENYREERNVKNYYDLIKENYFSRKNELFIPTTEETLEELLSS